MKRKQFIPIITILITLSACALLPATFSIKPNTVRIGVVFPRTSSYTQNQPVFEEIIEPDINAYIEKLPIMRFKPELNIEFLYEDGGEFGEPGVHQDKVEYFASMGIDIIIGGFYSSQAMAALNYMNENQMLLFSPSSTAPILAIPDDVLYRLAPADTIQGKAIAEMIISKGVTSLIVIQQEGPVGTWSYDAFLPAYIEGGGSILDHFTFDPEDPNYLDCLADAEAVATGSADEGILLFAFQEAVDILLEVSFPSYSTIYNLPWFGWESTAMRGDILEWAPVTADHVKLYSPMSVPDHSSKYLEMAERYEIITGESLTLYAANMIDAAWIITQAVLETKPSLSAPGLSINAVDVIEVLPDVASRYYGYSGWCQLDEAGDRANANYEIWGYGFDGAEPIFVKYGWYDMWTDTMYWD